MRQISILILCLLTLRCNAGRPGTDEARSFFEQRYPYAALLEVKEGEAEGEARSFVFSYRKSGQNQAGEIAIRFVKDPSTGRWSPEPEEPRSLP